MKTHDAEFEAYKVGREYFPIPQTEFDNSPGMVQNTRY
ncbi:MAG: RagB/SusD family nutrient uptake outer membrane protein [Mangrovibacterium sp.]